MLVFHPDKSRNNAFAAEYFYDIQEAYEVLSSPMARRAYDREYQLSGLIKIKQKATKPQDLLKQVQQLANDVRRMDVYRIDMPWLKSSIVFHLSSQNIATLSEHDLEPLRTAFLLELLSVLKLLHYPFSEDIATAMNVLSAQDETSFERWRLFLKAKKRQYLFKKWLPWVGVIITIGLCLAMYFYGQQ